MSEALLMCVAQVWLAILQELLKRELNDGSIKVHWNLEVIVIGVLLSSDPQDFEHKIPIFHQVINGSQDAAKCRIHWCLVCLWRNVVVNMIVWRRSNMVLPQQGSDLGVPSFCFPGHVSHDNFLNLLLENFSLSSISLFSLFIFSFLIILSEPWFIKVNISIASFSLWRLESASVLTRCLLISPLHWCHL